MHKNALLGFISACLIVLGFPGCRAVIYFSANCVSLQVKRIFRSQYEEVIVISRPDEEDRFNFFQDLILSQAAMPPPKKKNTGECPGRS